MHFKCDNRGVLKTEITGNNKNKYTPPTLLIQVSTIDKNRALDVSADPDSLQNPQIGTTGIYYSKYDSENF